MSCYPEYLKFTADGDSWEMYFPFKVERTVDGMERVLDGDRNSLEDEDVLRTLKAVDELKRQLMWAADELGVEVPQPKKKKKR